MKKIVFFSFLVFLFCVQNVFCQSTSDSLSVSLSAVDVNARRNQIYTGAGRVVTVVEREAIKQMPVQNVDELLESVAGIDIRQRGVGGTQSDISIRGGSFDQVLVLLNGVNITDPQTGHYNLDVPVELSDIVRVELLQGSVARIYGPNAFSGAINIVTEKEETSTISVQTAGGSYNSFIQNLSAGIGNGQMQSFFSVTRKSSDGYIANTDFEIKNIFSQSILNTKSAGKFGLQLAYQEKSYGANGFYSLAYPNQFDHTKTIYGALDWKQSISAKVNLTAQLYSRRHYDRFELFRNMENAASWYTGHNYHLTDVKGARAVLALLTRYGNFKLGADVRNEHIYSTVLGNNLNEAVQNKFDKDIYFTKASQRFLPGFFADYALSVQSLFLSAGFSHTFSSQFGNFTAGGFEIAYHFTDNFRLFLLANSAVRLPTFTDLYYKSATQIANPDLQPESAKTIELGTKFEKKNLKFSGALFYRMGGNVIDWVKEPDSTRWESRNLTEVNVFGIDFSTEYRFQTSFIKKLALSYSFLIMDKSAGSYDSKYALDYLRNKLILSADHNLYKSLDASWKLSYVDRAGDYTDFKTAAKTNYEPYFMADVRLQWSKINYDLYLDLNNIGAVQYADFGGLTQPGRNFMAGVRLRLE